MRRRENETCRWHTQLTVSLVAASLLSLSTSVLAQETPPEDSIVTYPASFFDRYQPNTALDMVRQLPGFQLDDGDNLRGFGGSVGNLLINDRYPSAKQDKPSTILSRIAASRVASIELIRSQVGDIDLRGRPVVANVILGEDDGKAATRWEVSLRKNFEISSLTPSGSISVSDRWRSTNFNIGFDIRKAGYGDPGIENVFDGTGALIEERAIDHAGRGFTTNGYLNASRWVGETLWQLNMVIGLEVREEDEHIANSPLEAGVPPSDEFFQNDRRSKKIEIGLDAERNLAPNWLGKGILLFFRHDQEPFSSQRSFDELGDQTLYREADTDALSSENIVRFEFDWTGMADHVIQINIEGARNVLDSELIQTVDTGNGPVIVPVPGANTRVEELRAEIQINDTFHLGKLELNYGLGAETSTIEQSGDAEAKRSFFYVKPYAILTYAATPRRQSRIRIAREVSQLDFKDFVSATIFEDDNVLLGNPDLRPESTWILEASEERRFGELGVIRLTAFHHWITDVEDLLPLDVHAEAPGNIGDGRRWGIILDATLPLDALGLSQSRLDVKARWQDSTVVDPVTETGRVLSAEGGHRGPMEFRGENEYAIFVDFRQDFDAAQVAWGWDFSLRAERPLFKVDEYDVYDEETDLNAFIETTRWFGIKTRLSWMNILDLAQSRDRTVYVGERELSPVDFRVVRTTTDGTRILLTFSGAF